MAIIHCKECNGKVSDKALMCPHCGFGTQKNLENILLTQKSKTASKASLMKPTFHWTRTKDGGTKESTLN